VCDKGRFMGDQTLFNDELFTIPVPIFTHLAGFPGRGHGGGHGGAGHRVHAQKGADGTEKALVPQKQRLHLPLHAQVQSCHIYQVCALPWSLQSQAAGG